MQRTPVSSRPRPRAGATLLTAPSTVDARANFATPLVPAPRLRNGRFGTESQIARERIDERTEQVESLRRELGSAFSTPAPGAGSGTHSRQQSLHSQHNSQSQHGLQSRQATPGSALQSMGSLNAMFSPRNPSLVNRRPIPPTTSSQFGQMFAPNQPDPIPSIPSHHQVQLGPSPAVQIPQSRFIPPSQSAPAVPQNWQNPRALTEEELCRERDRIHPDIRAIQLNSSSWPTSTKNLSLISLNFSAWNRALDNVLSVNGQLRLHLTSPDEYFCPDPNLFPTSALNWKTNDQAIIGFIKSKVQAEEYIVTDDETLDTAYKLYSALAKRHMDRGAVAQVKMLEEAFLTKFSSRSEHNITSNITKLVDLNKAIWSSGAPTEDLFLCILLLKACQPAFPTLFDSINDSFSSTNPPTSMQVIQKIQNFVKSPTAKASESANVATVVNATTSSANPSCRNCASKGISMTRHQDRYCILEGGGMFGKTIAEATAQRKKDREDRDKKKPTATANVATEKTDAPPTSEAFITHLNLATSPLETVFDARLSGVMSDIEKSEYENFLCIMRDSEEAVVDWDKSARDTSDLAFDAILPMPIDTLKPTQLSDDPWLKDSGASIHISNDRRDFKTLFPLKTPRIVSGIGGSSIAAVGVGSIEISISSGTKLLLEPVLFIPNSTVKLLSVSLLTEAGFEVAFNHPDSSIRHLKSQALVATGTKIPGRNVYKLNTVPLFAHHSNSALYSVAPRIPTLQTWHNRCGHNNYQSVLDTATKGHAEDAVDCTED
ncbi:hypothetical protein C8J56DRAFT_937092 [Mycena floridula]|nr:hypothetical protein C8J56DRAFT_937092 [Mycena floridula]